MTSLPQHACAILDRTPTAPAIEFGRHWHTSGEQREIAEGVMGALDASGLAPNALVAFVPRNHPSAIAALQDLFAQGRTIRMIYQVQ